MRVLRPEDAQERKEKILNWVVHNYVTKGKPISSDFICESSDFNLSSATIRSILKNLEEEGYLIQLHTSGGRIPSDKGYRIYVDSLLKLQNIAETEKEKLELNYDRRMGQIDSFLKNTSKILADMSKMAGFNFFSDINNEALKRLDIIKISSKKYLFILVTDSNIIKHIPFNTEKTIEISKLRDFVLNFNKKFKNININIILKEIKSLNIKDSTEKELFLIIFKIITNILKEEDSLYLNGLSEILNNDNYDEEETKSLVKLLEEKEKFSYLLKEKMKEISSLPAISYEKDKKNNKHSVEVCIGRENSIKEFKNLSFISSTYSLKDKTIGMVGVIGHKRMEYPKIINIVETVSNMMEEVLSDDIFFDDEEF